MEANITPPQLARYIGSGLKIKVIDKIFTLQGLSFKTLFTEEGFVSNMENMDLYIPIFRPWSHLVEKDENGITDIERLAIITDCDFEKMVDCFTYDEGVTVGIYAVRYQKKDGTFCRLSFDSKNYRFFTKFCMSAINQLQLFDFLFENRYNCYNAKCIYE